MICALYYQTAMWRAAGGEGEEPQGSEKDSEEIRQLEEGGDMVDNSEPSGGHKTVTIPQRSQPKLFITYVCVALGLTAPDLPFPMEWVLSVCGWRINEEDPTGRSGELNEDL